jgi:hypothetical protein
MTDLQLLGILWPFFVLGLFVLFGNVLHKRDLADYERTKNAARENSAKQLAE